MGYSDFFKDIQSGSLAPVYLLYGLESYLMNAGLDQLRSAYVQEAYSDFNWQVLDGTIAEIDEILANCETLPFFDERKFVIVKEAPYFKATKNRMTTAHEDALVKYLDNAPGTTCLLFLCEGKPDKRKKPYKRVKKVGQVIEFAKLDARDFGKWIAKRMKEAGVECGKREQQHLVEQLGYLDYGSEKTLYEMANKLDVLMGAAGEGGSITIELIDRMIERPLERNVFDMVDAVGQGRVEDALKILHKLSADGEAEIKIMAMVTRHFRMLVKTKAFLEAGYSPSVVASRLKLPPFVVKKQVGQVKRFDGAHLHKLLNICLATEHQMKTGQINSRLGLEMLFVRCAGKA